MASKRISARLALLAATAWLCVVSPPAGAQAMPSVYLIQNSGWMEPFFRDERYDFKSFVRTLIHATRPAPPATPATKPDTSPIVIASFNQDGQVPGEKSPLVLYEGPREAGPIARAVDDLRLPFKPGGSAYTDADFHGALLRTISELLNNKTGIIWFVTNNKNAPDNNPDVDRNTMSFFRVLSEEDAIARVIAFPINQTVRGERYSAKGFIVYGIAYGRRASVALGRIAVHGAANRALGIRAATLKPLTREAIRFVPTAVDVEGARAVLSHGVLVLDALSADDPQSVTVTGELHSNYYPQVIDAATIRTRWRGIDEDGKSAEGESSVRVSVSPDTVSGLGPDGIIDGVRLTLELPAVARPSGWKGLLVDETSLRGILEIRLGDLRLGLQPAFADKMDSVFGMSSLPGIFFAHRNTAQAVTSQPISLRLVHSAGPLIAAVSGAAGALAVLLGGLFWLLYPRERRIRIDGELRRARLRAFQSTELTGGDGRTYRVRGTLFRKATPVPVSQDGPG